MNDTASTGDLAPSSEDATSASIIEDTIPGGICPSTSIDVLTGQLSEDTVEATAPANIIEETMPDDRETSIRNEALTHVNIPDPTSGKATVDEDSTVVAMDEGILIPVERTGGEALSVVSASAGNVDHDTIIVEEEEGARFELDEEGPQPIMIEDDNEQIADICGLTQPIAVDDSDDEQIDEALAYIRDIGRLNQVKDNHVGYVIKVFERLIEQVGSRDAGEPDDADHQGRSIDGYLLSEMDATSRTIGSLDWIMTDVQKYRTKLSRARKHQKKQRAARRV
ncbi:uncharacterized protein RSE6_14799 [Rhynchosporium secalis]|uniref:Uncharacterized protein n=1 Tax=Rhynchosporium secalis TaxID=38038 RepID=A0A1E1MW73_RHYSE|nr:uncharacterized protein RSE6_14799 [Rhynchosporium secalis]